MRPRTVLEPDDKARLRDELEHGDKPMWQLGEEFGLHPNTIRDMARREGWMWRSQRARKPMPLAVPRPAPPPIDPGAPPPQVDAGPMPADAAPLAERVQRQVEQALSAIERIVPQLGAAPAHPGAERAARTLASLVKTLHELRRLRAAETPAAADSDAEDSRDYDQLRQELVESLERLATERTDPLPDGA